MSVTWPWKAELEEIVTMELEICKKQQYAVITMNSGENKITPEVISTFHTMLDKIESMHDIEYLVTIGCGKYFSTGVDLDIVKSTDSTPFLNLLSDLQKLLSRLLVFPIVTVAAINGHCVGGGAMLALAHDIRVMRDDRGWFFVPIARLGFTLPVGLLKLVGLKVCQPYLHLLVTGTLRFSAEMGKNANFIAEVSPPSNLHQVAHRVGKAASDAKLDRQVLKNMKKSLYCNVYKALSGPSTFYSHL